MKYYTLKLRVTVNWYLEKNFRLNYIYLKKQGNKGD